MYALGVFECKLSPSLLPGRLVGAVVEEVVARVVTLEDISVDAALSLIRLLTLLKDFVPSLFKVINGLLQCLL